MTTYLLLNLVFIVMVIGLLRIKLVSPSRPVLITFGVLLALTTVFDSLIIAADIVRYDYSKILGIFVGLAPIEDFFYAVLAVVIVPILWQRFKKAPSDE